MKASLTMFDLNILLMKNGIISISEWDVQLAVFLKESAAQLSDNVLQFVADFLEGRHPYP